jgi:hypothetical protein
MLEELRRVQENVGVLKQCNVGGIEESTGKRGRVCGDLWGVATCVCMRPSIEKKRCRKKNTTQAVKTTPHIDEGKEPLWYRVP